MKRTFPLVPIVILGSLIYASSAFLTVPSTTAVHSMFIQMDAVAHVFLYFFLGLLVTRYVSVGLQINAVGALVIATALCVTFGVLDEFHQMYVPNRGAEFRDVLWDLVGATAGGLLYVLVVGFGRWIRDFLSSAEIGTARVFGRAAVAVVFLVSIIVPTVVYAGRIADLVQSIVVDGSSYAASVVDSYLRTPKVARSLAHPSPAKAPAANLASFVPLVEGAAAYPAKPVIQPGATPDKTIDAYVPRHDLVEVKTIPARNPQDSRLEQLGKELLGENFRASSARVVTDKSHNDLATVMASIGERPGDADAIGTVGNNLVLRNTIVQAIGSSAPQVRHAVHTWQGRPQPGTSKRLLGLGNSKPEACDLVAVIAPRSSPVNELTVDQVQKIFSGEIKNWREVGGPDQPIKVVTVRKQSGDFERFLTNHLKSGLSSNAIRLPFVSLMIPVVAETKGAVGFLPVQNTEQLDWVAGHEAFMRIGIKSSKMSHAVEPNRMAYNTGQYPFMKSVAPAATELDRKAHQYALARQGRRGRY